MTRRTIEVARGVPKPTAAMFSNLCFFVEAQCKFKNGLKHANY